MSEQIQINDIAPRIAYVANGVQTAFTYPFAIFRPEDLEVWLDDVRQTAGFSVSGAGVSSGGTAVFAVPPANGARVTLRRRLAVARTVDLQFDGIIRANLWNDALNFQTAALQQVADDVSRAVARSVTSGSAASLVLPEPEPGKALGWNVDGSGLTNDPADFVAAATAAADALAQANIAGARAAEAATHAAAAQSAQANANTARGAAEASAEQAAASAAAANVARIEWKGAWSAATAYAVNDAVSHSGGAWICVSAHANQAPADNAYWDILAAKGIDGSGSGDLQAVNNLSDVASAATARANLGAAAASHAHASTDVSDFTEATQDVVGAMIAAAGGGYDDAAGTVTLPSGTAQAVLDRLAFLEQNLALNTLRDQIDTGWSVLKMVDGVADEFEDTAGLASNTGTHDATGDYIHNPAGSGGTTVLSTGGTAAAETEYAGNEAIYAFDGNAATSYLSAAITTGWLSYSWGAAKLCNRYAITAATGGEELRAPYNWTFEGWNGSSWVVLDTQSSVVFSAGQTRTYDIANTSSCTAYRLNVTAVNGGNRISVAELVLNNVAAPTPPGDIAVVSVATAALTQPSEARLVLLHQPVNAVTLNTDVTIEASRDNGATWTAGTLASEGAFDASTNILSATIDLSGQPAGTQMMWRYKTFNAKEQRLHGVWMQWR